MQRSSALNLSYIHFPNRKILMFEDGISYTEREAVALAKVKSPADLKAIHAVKSVFGGEVTPDFEDDKNDSWFDKSSPYPEAEIVDPPTSKIKVKKEIVPDAEVLSIDL